VKNELAGVNRNAAVLTADATSASDELVAARAQLAAVSQRGAAAERRAREVEDALVAARQHNAELGEKLEAAGKFEAEAHRHEGEKQALQAKMETWESRMKLALKENRKKEQEHVANEIQQRQQIATLQERLDKALFDLQTAKVKAGMKREYVDGTAQTDPLPTPPPLAPTFAAAATPTPNKLQAGSGGEPSASFRSPSPHPPGGARPGTPTLVRADADPFAAPPAIMPEVSADPARPMIVSVHYNEGEFSIEKKYFAKEGMKVGDLIAQVCEQVNYHHRKALDCAEMCLKTLHSKAKRRVVLSNHRELHSFAYFQKCARADPPLPILLYLEPVPPNAVFASPTSRLSQARGGSASQARPSVPR